MGRAGSNTPKISWNESVGERESEVSESTPKFPLRGELRSKGRSNVYFARWLLEN
jgi:hypothetical protein